MRQVLAFASSASRISEVPPRIRIGSPTPTRRAVYSDAYAERATLAGRSAPPPPALGSTGQNRPWLRARSCCRCRRNNSRFPPRASSQKNHLDHLLSAAMPGELVTISVSADDWFGAHLADQKEYQAAARLRGVVIAKEGGNATRDVLVVMRQGNPSRSEAAVSYEGLVGCRRARWEHELRRLLDLEDPCFQDEPPFGNS